MPVASLTEIRPTPLRSSSAGLGRAALRLGLFARVHAQLRLKLTLLVILTLLFCVPYFLIGYFPIRPPQPLPLTALDRAIPFDVRWCPVYQSLYLLIPLAPFLITSRRALVRYVSAFTLITATGLAICFLFPTLCPRPTDFPSAGLYALVIAYDPPTNAFPSMHIALALQSLLLGIHMLRTETSRWLWPLSILGTLWLLAIAYSTLATKQHYAVDLLAGAFLAGLCHVTVFRGRAA